VSFSCFLDSPVAPFLSPSLVLVLVLVLLLLVLPLCDASLVGLPRPDSGNPTKQSPF